MTQLLENMLYILKKKLINKILIFFIFFLVFFFPFSLFAIEQGKHTPDAEIYKIYKGMTKKEVKKYLGNPIFYFNLEKECWFYFYLYIPSSCRDAILKEMIFLQFYNNILLDYFIIK